MRSSVCVILAFLLLFASFLSSLALAAEPWSEDMPAGEVLYRQSFADVSDYAKSGLVTGTATAEKAEIAVKDGALNVRSVDGGRAYTLLPQIARGTSYTVEFSFRFTESGRENGTLAFLLTCRGEEPTNVTSLVIRANGTIDDFSEPDEALARAIKGGLWVTVKIPIEDGALHRLLLVTEDAACAVERTSVLVLTPGSMGFAFRNTCAALSDIWIVNGTGYAEKTGDLTSYAVDAEGESAGEEKPDAQKGTGTKIEPQTAPAKPDPSPPMKSPNTRDRIPGLVAALSVTSVCALGCGFSVRRRSR